MTGTPLVSAAGADPFPFDEPGRAPDAVRDTTPGTDESRIDRASIDGAPGAQSPPRVATYGLSMSLTADTPACTGTQMVPAPVA
jgi:hypothetical protein